MRALFAVSVALFFWLGSTASEPLAWFKVPLCPGKGSSWFSEGSSSTCHSSRITDFAVTVSKFADISKAYALTVLRVPSEEGGLAGAATISIQLSGSDEKSICKVTNIALRAGSNNRRLQVAQTDLEGSQGFDSPSASRSADSPAFYRRGSFGSVSRPPHRQLKGGRGGGGRSSRSFSSRSFGSRSSSYRSSYRSYRSYSSGRSYTSRTSTRAVSNSGSRSSLRSKPTQASPQFVGSRGFRNTNSASYRSGSTDVYYYGFGRSYASTYYSSPSTVTTTSYGYQGYAVLRPAPVPFGNTLVVYNRPEPVIHGYPRASCYGSCGMTCSSASPTHCNQGADCCMRNLAGSGCTAGRGQHCIGVNSGNQMRDDLITTAFQADKVQFPLTLTVTATITAASSPPSIARDSQATPLPAGGPPELYITFTPVESQSAEGSTLHANDLTQPSTQGANTLQQIAMYGAIGLVCCVSIYLYFSSPECQKCCDVCCTVLSVLD